MVSHTKFANMLLQKSKKITMGITHLQPMFGSFWPCYWKDSGSFFIQPWCQSHLTVTKERSILPPNRFRLPPKKINLGTFVDKKMPKKTTVVLNGSLVFLAGPMKARKVSMIVGPSSTRWPFPSLHLRCCHKAVELGKCNSLCSFSKNCSPEAMMTERPWNTSIAQYLKRKVYSTSDGTSFLRHLQVKKDRIQAIAAICRYKSHDHFKRNTGII